MPEQPEKDVKITLTIGGLLVLTSVIATLWAAFWALLKLLGVGVSWVFVLAPLVLPVAGGIALVVAVVLIATYMTLKYASTKEHK